MNKMRCTYFDLQKLLRINVRETPTKNNVEKYFDQSCRTIQSTPWIFLVHSSNGMGLETAPCKYVPLLLFSFPLFVLFYERKSSNYNFDIPPYNRLGFQNRSYPAQISTCSYQQTFKICLLPTPSSHLASKDFEFQFFEFDGMLM